MSGSPTGQYSEAQRREAADWFVVINEEDDLAAETLQAWLQWMETHDGNRRAFEAVAQAWHSMPNMPAVAMPSQDELLLDTYDGDHSVSEWNAARRPVSAAVDLPLMPRGRFLSSKRAWLAAASLAGLLLGGAEYMWQVRGRGLQSDEFATRTGEQIQLTLADGSRVWLGPRSKLLVGFTATKRNLQLIAGEAFFAVKKDGTRPFVVHSEGGDITAVGTAFNVRNVDRNVLLTVSEGVVTVAPSQTTATTIASGVRVASGQQVTFNAHSATASLAIQTSAASGERARWRDGILVYRDESLSSVIKDVSRYLPTPIDIPEPNVGELRYSGVVYIRALDEWLAALPESFPVRVISLDDKKEIRSR